MTPLTSITCSTATATCSSVRWRGLRHGGVLDWSYDDCSYNEKSNPGPTLPRDFRGNVLTLSPRYSM